MTAATGARPAFGALRHRNFRLFLAGQFVSLSGTWMQTVAQGWLVFQLTNSAFQVGLVTTVNTLPVLLFTLYGGVVADRVNKRRFLLVLQSLMLVEALALAILTATGRVTVGWVMVLAAMQGLLAAFEIPARQSFLVEMTGRDDLMTAIALNSSAFNVTRVIGPAVAGIVIASIGIAACFFVNAASYLAVLWMLAILRPPFAGASSAPPGPSSFVDGWRYIMDTAEPRLLTLMTITFSVFGFSFAPMLPVFASQVLGAGATGYGMLMSGVGVGAAAAALFVAAMGHRVQREGRVFAFGTLFGIVLIATSLAGGFAAAFLLLTLAGCTWALTSILTNTLLQTKAPDHLRGRVMGFYSFMVVGMAPLGALQAGWVSEHFGVQSSLALGGMLCVAAALLGWRRSRSPVLPAGPATTPPPTG
ncbi:MAG TPA: MFS transporter [Gemmatimonadales bacterium]|nr:MFS transporter [Gemmatimonadales bacterium]